MLLHFMVTLIIKYCNIKYLVIFACPTCSGRKVTSSWPSKPFVKWIELPQPELSDSLGFAR